MKTQEELQAEVDALRIRIEYLQDQIAIQSFLHKYGKSDTVRMKAVMELLAALRIST